MNKISSDFESILIQTVIGAFGLPVGGSVPNRPGPW